jgi:hypothetical protein
MGIGHYSEPQHKRSRELIEWNREEEVFGSTELEPTHCSKGIYASKLGRLTHQRGGTEASPRSDGSPLHRGESGTALQAGGRGEGRRARRSRWRRRDVPARSSWMGKGGTLLCARFCACVCGCSGGAPPHRHGYKQKKS